MTWALVAEMYVCYCRSGGEDTNVSRPPLPDGRGLCRLPPDFSADLDGVLIRCAVPGESRRGAGLFGDCTAAMSALHLVD